MPHIRTRRAVAAAIAAALALSANAAAHVTLQPSSVPADGYTRLDVRVPNERDDAATIKVDVQFPPGFESVSYEPRPGWKATVERDGENVSRVTWSGGRIAPGEFVDFGISLRMPEGEDGEQLTFKALQTYEGGEVVRWIGPEESEEPAPVVTLTAAATGGTAGGDTPISAENASATTTEDDGGGDGLAIAALAVGIVALAGAAGALLTARRRPREA